MQMVSFSTALRKLSSKTKPKTTPLGKIETVRITEEDYKRLQWKKYKSKNIAVGLLLLGGVLSVYGYSMYAVSQDPIQLDEIEGEVNSKSSN